LLKKNLHNKNNIHLAFTSPVDKDQQ